MAKDLIGIEELKTFFNAHDKEPIDPKRIEDIITPTIARLSDVEDAVANIPQTDWNAKEGEVGHIKNRTHWEDYAVVLFEEQTVSHFSDQGGVFAAYGLAGFDVEDGKTYTVTWDGDEYERTAIALGAEFVIGNQAIVDATSGDDTPFVIFVSPSNTTIGTRSTAPSHTIGVRLGDNVVHHLDEKYIPNTIARLSDVEAMITGAIGGSY